MKIRILAFASVADLLGGSELDVELSEGSGLAHLRDRLVAEHPELEPHWPRLAVAVNGDLAAADADLEDGAEVALLPPVSGGDHPAPQRLTEDPIVADDVVDLVAGPTWGAVLVFLGTVRNHHEGRPVNGITYSAYRSMAEATLDRIVTELEAGEPGLRLEIVHRLGDIPAGDASVAIVAASAHREAAYAASRAALERLKREVPIWKREHYTDGDSRWREEEPLTMREASGSPLRS